MESTTQRLTIAAPTFVSDVLMPRLAVGPRALRGISLPRAHLRRYADEQLFDAVVTIGPELELPKPWATRRVGELECGFFAAEATVATLGLVPTLADLRRCSFVGPVHVSRAGELVPGDDGCPIAHAERRITHEVESMRLACLVAAETDCVVFGPVLAAAPFLAEGALVEVVVSGWSKADPVYLAADTRRLDTNDLNDLVAELHVALGAKMRGSGVVSTSSAPPPRASDTGS